MALMDLLTKWSFKVDDKPLDDLKSRMDGLQSRLSILAGAELAKGIINIAQRWGAFAAQLTSSATAAGISVESLQRLQASARQVGASTEDVSGAVSHLTTLLFQARKGSEEASKAFTLAGITQEQAAGYRSGADAIAAVADKMQSLTDPIEKQALAQAALGSSSGEMIAWLSKGGAAIKAEAGAAGKLGGVLSGETVASLRATSVSLANLTQLFANIASQIGAVFGPVIRAVVRDILGLYSANKKTFSNQLIAWAKIAAYALGFVMGLVSAVTQRFHAFADAHPELIKWAGRLGMGLVALATGGWALTKAFDAAKGIFGLVGDALGILGAPFKLVGGLVAWLVRGSIGLIAKFGVLIAEVFPAVSEAVLAFASALNATPIGLIVAGIAALVLGVQALWTVLRGGKFEDTWLGKLWEGAQGAAKTVGRMLGLVSDDTKDAERAQSDEASRKSGTDVPDIVAMSRGAMGNLADLPARNLAPPNGALDPSRRMMPAQSGAQQTTINAPITINGLPPGTNAQNVADRIAQAVREHVDAVHRTAMSNVKTVVAN